ncbi:MAG: DUF6142 family protein [Clostridiaceae bacterium]|nr:DUF6142 family protein [Clostridiaceae bacterium]
MKRKKRKKGKSLQLTDKKHPLSAIVAMFLGILSLSIFAVICFVSGESDGNAGIYVGVVGLFCFLLSIIGFVVSWMSLRGDNIRPLFPTIASVINGLLLVCYLLVYIWGTFI